MSAPNIFTSPFHEHDPRWTAIDAYTQRHLFPSTSPSHIPLQSALEHSRDSGLPDIASFPTLSKFFALQCRLGDVEHALEVGTLGGYTPIWLTSLNPSLRVTSLEVSEKHALVARENLERAGVSDRVEVIVGNAMTTLPRLVEDVQNGTRPRVGFTYIDADKERNWEYFDMAVRMSTKGAGIYVDNLVQRGKLVAERFEEGDEDEEDVMGARKLIESVGRDGRVEAVVLQTVSEKSYDGFMCAVVL